MPTSANSRTAQPFEKGLLNELYSLSNAKAFGVSETEFEEVLARIDPPVSTGTNKTTAVDFYRSLRLEELALARGCAAGHDSAWEVFLIRFREKLYDSARHITREDSSARELADSLYADLYGTTVRDGVRVSKLSFYTGRGSLEGWLRTVLAQEWVNRYRKRKREVSIEEESDEGAQLVAPQPVEIAAIDQPVVAATDAALSGLAPEDRYILSSYYLDKRTLADIARTLRVHESTISRKVEKLANVVRKNIVDRLIKSGMSKRQAEEALDFDVRDWPADLRAQLSREAPDQALPGPNISLGLAQESLKETFPVVEEKKESKRI
ncbi:MAG: sigma-24, subfamily [Acidobacteriales bacterium]|nr:sigma-24, subfamily [Terriglobales bacterium]